MGRGTEFFKNAQKVHEKMLNMIEGTVSQNRNAIPLPTSRAAYDPKRETMTNADKYAGEAGASDLPGGTVKWGPPLGNSLAVAKD